MAVRRRTAAGGDGEGKSMSDASGGAGATKKKVKDSESAIVKGMVRTIAGASMIAGILGSLYMGHFMVTLLVGLMQVGMFRELLVVRYKKAQEREIPWFRSIHYLIFCAGLWSAHGAKILTYNLGVHPLMRHLLRYHEPICFGAYAALFVLFVLSLKRGYYKYQLGQLTWTLLLLFVVVFQTRAITLNIYEGLFWFVFPAGCVVCNDTFAYVFGRMLGRTIVRTPLLKLSPNKSWEGFLGAAVATTVHAFLWSWIFAQFSALTCPYDPTGACVTSQVFISSPMQLPSFLQSSLALVWADAPTHVNLAPVQLHSVAFALFASFVAPFGGFFASAIKRAYELDDFASMIPGHGGLTDRLDCQLIMGMFTWVYVSTFIRPLSVTVSTLLVSAASLPLTQQKLLTEQLVTSLRDQGVQLAL